MRCWVGVLLGFAFALLSWLGLVLVCCRCWKPQCFSCLLASPLPRPRPEPEGRLVIDILYIMLGPVQCLRGKQLFLTVPRHVFQLSGRAEEDDPCLLMALSAFHYQYTLSRSNFECETAGCGSADHARFQPSAQYGQPLLPKAFCAIHLNAARGT